VTGVPPTYPASFRGQVVDTCRCTAVESTAIECPLTTVCSLPTKIVLEVCRAVQGTGREWFVGRVSCALVSR
jgi:hypothetical protein